jgi:hypothetical protein
VHPGLAPVFAPAAPAPLHRLARQIMASRVAVSSSGRIGYLEPARTAL